ncbi:MAG: Rrf2 family transcriptional regulator, partial [Gammaproteobacteria bacterium]|nr:Rrf2 family transcriptional regulator [Gammaproteobacteria bacterium]NIR95582.1 Rrf2 family transcriptional regulator [Gammaproteobacteria bacterium]NIW46847.1 Rrf2 family transcriptional regulator [Gammaproteobacteria bacterium]NIX57882.1 Rrf2 family transcriptional regulator [candidate division Zixibacteria bacterium]
FLRKLLQPLIKSGIIESKRGYSGGIRLARMPEQISLLEIIESVEGGIELNECVADPAICQFVGSCPIHEVWVETTNILGEHLGE